MTLMTAASAMRAEDRDTAARASAGAFPDAPLAMPVQDMSPATLRDVLHNLLPPVLRRLLRGAAIRN